VDDFSTSSLLYLIYVFILRRRLSVFSPSPPRESSFFFLPPLEGGSEREGGGFSAKRFFEGNHPHPNPLPSRERGKRCKALPSRERGKTSGIAKRDKPKVVIAKPCLVTHDERRGS